MISDFGFRISELNAFENPQFAIRNPQYPMDIQFFATAEEEGRTEDPTARQRQKAEGKGSFPRTRDLGAPAAILFCCVFLQGYLPELIDSLMKFTVMFLSGEILPADPGVRDLSHMSVVALKHVIWVSLPVMLLAALIIIIAEIVQVGFHFNPNFIKFNFSALKPDLSRVFQKFLPKRETLIELGKSIGKILIAGGVGFGIVWANYGALVETIRMGLVDGLIRVGQVTFDVVFWTTLLLICFAIPDYFYQRYQHTDKLKMTKESVKDEHKQMEGDPLIKGEQRKRMADLFSRRMMEKVPKADVVITNPTHYAVALKYDQEDRPAPYCLAKGRDYVALRIRALAEKAGVPVYEDRFLARALYDAVEIGEEIPSQFYESVAEVLAFVYRLREKEAAGV
ncbi:EscU/YscU/HrcU family type III secretion system export apparatus switch protein [bacterium]|nr:EscU/YscU/HrcU family type III secretion system export apparatus switch protein [bacterium]